MYTDLVMAGMKALTFSDYQSLSYSEIITMWERVELINAKEEESYNSIKSQIPTR